MLQIIIDCGGNATATVAAAIGGKSGRGYNASTREGSICVISLLSRVRLCMSPLQGAYPPKLSKWMLSMSTPRL